MLYVSLITTPVWIFRYFMRHKNKSARVTTGFFREMQRLEVRVRTIQSGRGSEYFSQGGDAHKDRDRRQAEVSKARDTYEANRGN